MTLLGRRLRWPVLVAAGVVAVAVVLAYAVRSDGSDADYRLVRAGTGDVEQVLSVGGTVDAARRADLVFATGGTVADVAVAQGDKVSAGQVVATLDTTSLRAAVVRAEASLAQAKAQLESDRAAQTEAVGAASGQSSPQGSGTPSGSAPSGSGTTPAVLATLKRQQAAVLSAQTAASKAIAAAKAALAAQATECERATRAAAAGSDDSGDDSGDDGAGNESSSGDGASGGSGDEGGQAVEAAMAACTAALDTVRDRQDDVAKAQDTLAKALDALTATLSKALGSVSKGATGPTGSPGSSGSSGSGQGAAARSTASSASTASTPSTSSGSAGSSGSSAGTVTAARLASDQASIDQAAADLAEAEEALDRATLTATRSGRVASVGVSAGDSVSAGDTAVVVIGGRAVTVTGAVTASQVGQVALGQTVRVTTPGSDQAATGTVSAVGLAGDSSSGTTTYPVTVMVEDPDISLPTGSRAMLAIVVGTASDVVTVPVSAVTRNGDSAVVRVERNGTLATQPVTLGTIGATRVAITEGLEAGTEVVLADLDQDITDASTSIGTRVAFGGGGPGGTVTFGGPPGMSGMNGGPRSR